MKQTDHTTDPNAPTILLIDDGDPKMPPAVERDFNLVRILSIDALDRYLEAMNPGEPPMAALIDVQFGRNDFGIGALFRLRRPASWERDLVDWKAKVTAAEKADRSRKSQRRRVPPPRLEPTLGPAARTVPILFTSTMSAGGENYPGWSYGDLHTLLCAAACRTGIHVASKDHDLRDLEATLRDVHRVWARRSSTPEQLAGVKHGDLLFVKPVHLDTFDDPAGQSLYRVLLGNEYKRRLWRILDEDRQKEEATVNTALRQLHTEFRAKKNAPSATLETRVDKPGRIDYPLRSLVGGTLGRLSTAWKQKGETLIDDETTLTRRISMRSDDASNPSTKPKGGYDAPSDDFRGFAQAYAHLLAHSDVGALAEWHLAHGWTD